MIDASFRKNKYTSPSSLVIWVFILPSWDVGPVPFTVVSRRFIIWRVPGMNLSRSLHIWTVVEFALNKKYWICIKRHFNIELFFICICKTCCKGVDMIVSTVTRRTWLCWMRIDIFRFRRRCGMNFSIVWCIIDTFICLSIYLGSWCICLLC